MDRRVLVASAAYFAYIALVALVLPPLRARVRVKTIGVACGAVALAVISAHSTNAIVHTWIVPPVLLLVAYWSSGWLFTTPMDGFERVLLACDHRLQVERIAGATPRVVAELLEAAYALVYPVIPLALLIALRCGESADRFWTVILVTDYICFACLPWLRSRPPRALAPGRPWRSRWRDVNLALLDTTSVRVNTFPSGHAAEGLAAALLTLSAPPAIVAGMFVMAAAIAAGAVFGRYHYALDALSGWAVVLVVWTLV